MSGGRTPARSERWTRLLLVVLVLIAVVLQVLCSVHWHSGPPNILLITVDLLRPRQVPAYSPQAPPMPNVAALAARGMVFDRAYAQTSLTSEAHMSLQTARYMSDIYGDRARGSTTPVFTIAETLKKQGYRTACVPGSSLLNSDIQLTYFRDVKFGRGFDEYFDVPLPPGERRWLTRRMGAESNKLALEWLSRQATPLARHPWYLHLNYRDLHGRWLAPGSSGAAAPPDKYPIDLPHSAICDLPAGYTRIETYVDDQVGEILSYLKASGMDQDTAIMFTADHCLGGTEHYGALYEEEVRVPMILVMPGMTSTARVPEIVQNIDIAPTLAQISGGRDPGWTAAKSLLALKPAEDYYAFAQTWALEASMVTNRRWKYIEYAKNYTCSGVRRNAGDRELYNLQDDPGEKVNLVTKHPDVAASLRKALIDRRLLEGPQPMDPAQMKHLKPLDYW